MYCVFFASAFALFPSTVVCGAQLYCYAWLSLTLAYARSHSRPVSSCGRHSPGCSFVLSLAAFFWSSSSVTLPFLCALCTLLLFFLFCLFFEHLFCILYFVYFVLHAFCRCLCIIKYPIVRTFLYIICLVLFFHFSVLNIL